MPFFTLPQSYIQGLEQLITIDDSQFESIIAALSSSEPSLSGKKFVDNVVRACSGIDEAVVRKIVYTVRSLISMKTMHEIDSEEIIADFSAFVERSDDFEKHGTQAKASLKARLEAIFSLKGGVRLSAKALDILTEHQNSFITARILTDMRPIFGESVKEKPAGVVLVHSLKLTYHTGSRRDEFFIALDNADLERLKLIINRAEDKATTLKELLKDSAVPYLEPEKEAEDD